MYQASWTMCCPRLSDSERVGSRILMGLLNFLTPAHQAALEGRVS